VARDDDKVSDGPSDSNDDYIPPKDPADNDNEEPNNDEDDVDHDPRKLLVKIKRDNLLDKESHPQAEASSTTISATPGPVMQYTALAGFPNLVVPALVGKASTPTRQDIDRLRLDLSGLDFTKNEMMSY